MHRLILQIYSILLLNIFLKETNGCYNFCVCKWKNGKQTVECSNQNLIEIPNGIDPETQVLEFSGNNLNTLQMELFLKKQIINLQRIYLSDCKIKTIHLDSFKGLTNLIELDLSNNFLEIIPADTFINSPTLMKLILNFNRIKILKKFSFNHLSHLTTLEISNCEISDVEEGVFRELHSLEQLRLDGNKLRTIQGQGSLPENIKGVQLQKNVWECDCHIQDLYAWLQDFRNPLSVEPVCNGPPRLTGLTIKSIPAAELACLPDISPTTFYLELGEGKNVSLLCHVHAIPEATVSWRFQGQMLQNNTMIAPGVHLIYFIEEGSENKFSELFIYNANADDNGTFVCNAENAAGKTQSNFTIKIILNEEPIVIIVLFPFDYFLFAVICVSVLSLIIIIGFTVLIRKCQKRQQNEKRIKELALQHQQNANRCLVLKERKVKYVPNSLKIDIATTNSDEDVLTYGEHLCEDLVSSICPAENYYQIKSASSLRRYQLEQNPDIINGTESIERRCEGDGEDEKIHKIFENELNPVAISYLCGSREFCKNVHCVMESKEYPIDYGLPKIPRQKQYKEDYYRTLPSNLLVKHTAANPINRFSREAEFLSRSMDSQYDYYNKDVRYTADGYPARIPVPENVLSAFNSTPSENYDTENFSSLTFCSIEKPTCVSANLHVTNSNLDNTKQKFSKVLRHCGSAKTNTNSKDSTTDLKKEKTENDIVNEFLTESPDEGYEGEPSVV